MQNKIMHQGNKTKVPLESNGKQQKRLTVLRWKKNTEWK